jgi:hypothetical protein
MRNADRVSAIIILGICAYFWVESRNFTRFGYLFPQVIVIILGLLSLALLVVSFVKPVERVLFKKEEGISYLPVVLSVVLMIAWVFFIKLLGFLVTSVVFFSLMLILFDRRKRSLGYYLVKVGTVALVVGAFYLFFARLLLVPFPRGILL